MARITSGVILVFALGVKEINADCIASYGQCLSPTDDNTQNCCSGSYCDGMNQSTLHMTLFLKPLATLIITAHQAKGRGNILGALITTTLSLFYFWKSDCFRQ